LLSSIPDDGPDFTLPPWAYDWIAQGRGWEYRLWKLAEGNPAEIRRLRRACTRLDLARSLKFRAADAVLQKAVMKASK